MSYYLRDRDSSIFLSSVFISELIQFDVIASVGTFDDDIGTTVDTSVDDIVTSFDTSDDDYSFAKAVGLTE